MVKPKILLVEDDQGISELYQLKFLHEGYQLLVAKDGIEGLEQARSSKPDLILLDVIMPNMDGFQMLETLKKDPALKDIRVVMLSNLGQQADIDKSKALGAYDYVIKASLTPSQVYDKVMTYLKS
jgi:CheY-like chemotaxis protein